jgi:hypothetical protein
MRPTVTHQERRNATTASRPCNSSVPLRRPGKATRPEKLPGTLFAGVTLLRHLQYLCRVRVLASAERYNRVLRAARQRAVGSAAKEGGQVAGPLGTPPPQSYPDTSLVALARGVTDRLGPVAKVVSADTAKWPSCAGERYELAGGLVRAVSWVGAMPLRKAALEVPVLQGASEFTNVVP